MTNSRSIASRSSWAAVASAVVALVVLLGAGSVAEAGRKRVVVLDFDGPKGDKFHDDLVKLIKKTHTVVPTEKWNGAAEQLDAGAVSDKNVKKVARKLKIDAIVEGKVEKRRDEFILRIKLRAGRSGGQVGDAIDTKAEGPRIDGRAQRDLKDELVGAIDNVESNHAGGGGDDDEPAAVASKSDDDPPPRKASKKVAEADDDKPVAKKGKKAEADDEEPKRGFSRRVDDERGGDKVDKKAKKPSDDAEEADDRPAKKASKAKVAADDDPPAKKPAAKVKADTKTDDEEDPPGLKKPGKKPAARARVALDEGDEPERRKSVVDDDAKPARRKSVASRDREEEVTEVDAPERETRTTGAAALSPGERAIDATVGLSVTSRSLTFSIKPGLATPPPNYKGIPVAGGLVDATIYPLAYGHKRSGQLKNLGIELLYDRVFKLSSKDPASSMTYSTVESRFSLGAVYRYPFSRAADSPVVVGGLAYESQQFNVQGPVSLPDVKYGMFVPAVGLRVPILSGKLIANADAKLLLVTSAGEIALPGQFGTATVLGFEGDVGADYRITPNLFARAAFRFETIGFTFKGTGARSLAADMTQGVSGARDTYLGGFATIGYAY